MNITWQKPPALRSYTYFYSAALQTALARFRSGHLRGLPDVRFSTGQSSFLHVSPVKRIWVNRTKECPVLNTFCVISGALDRQPTQRVGL
ncbi:hypothetical protein TNCV_1621831 [Trichonephila clavipes]|nr:hypothetical protein TNCV_1621831 [Trichonephila clavipes]